MTKDKLKTNNLRNLKEGVYTAQDSENNIIIIVRNRPGKGWVVKRPSSGSLKKSLLECTTYLENGTQIETYYEKHASPCPICGGISYYKKDDNQECVTCLDCGRSVIGEEVLKFWNGFSTQIDKRIAGLSESEAKVALLNAIHYISNKEGKVPESFQVVKDNAILNRFLKREW